MNLMDMAQLLGNFGEFVGAIAVVVTLFYLAFQVRQSKEATDANTRSVDESRRLAMAQAYRARAEAVIDFNLRVAITPDLRAVYSKIQGAWGSARVDAEATWAALTDDERAMLESSEMAKLIILDNAHYQHQQEFIDNEYYESTFVPRVQAWGPIWRAVGILDVARPSFVTEIDRILSKES